MSTMSSLDGVVKFDDLSYLDQEGDQVQRPFFIRFQITAGWVCFLSLRKLNIQLPTLFSKFITITTTINLALFNEKAVWAHKYKVTNTNICHLCGSVYLLLFPLFPFGQLSSVYKHCLLSTFYCKSQLGNCLFFSNRLSFLSHPLNLTWNTYLFI